MIKQKKKILTWCDTPTVPTGFGIVAKNLLRDIHKKYDLDILGINYQGDTKYDTEKWFIYPAGSPQDQLGLAKMKKILEETTPDIIFLFQDIFHINNAWGLIEKYAPNAKVIIYFPVDGTPFSSAWEKPLLAADVIITYTEFARQAIFDTFPDLKKEILILDHGIDTEVFKPLPEVEIRNNRLEWHWSNRFTVLNLNRFQPRKQIPLTLRAVSLFTKGYCKCKCGNWYLESLDYCDLNGCSKVDVTETVAGRPETMLYLHMVPHEAGMGPGGSNALESHVYNAGYRQEDLETGPKGTIQINSKDLYNDPFTEEALNRIYNSTCVNISTAVGEGFGFSLAEAQASGTVTISAKNSATPEVLGDTGHLIPNVGLFNMAMDNGHMRPIVDVRGVIEALEIEYQLWLANNKQPVKSQDSVDRVKRLFNWDDKRKFIENVFDSLGDSKSE